MPNNQEVTIVNMFSLSETMPQLGTAIISRDQYLDLFDEQLEEYKVVCVDGVEGVGLTTALALFAKRHSEECASYFNNGWSRHLLSPQTIIRSFLCQLAYYTKTPIENIQDGETLAPVLYKLVRMTRNRSKNIYFVLDGFAKIPPEYVDSIKATLAPLFNIDGAKFLFSGAKENISRFIPQSANIKQSNEMLRFQPNDVQDYLGSMALNLGEDDVDLIYALSKKGLARPLSILVEKLRKYGIEHLRNYYTTSTDDYFREDFEWIIEQKDEIIRYFFALLTFSELPQSRNSVLLTLEIEDDEISVLLEKCEDYVLEEDNLITLKSNDFRMYLREKLQGYKKEIELKLINMIEKSDTEDVKFLYLPPLYKHVNDNKTLVTYLTSDNVQSLLESKRSQAALNEQCEFGYNACTDFESQASAFFRFAINRSVSREIEKNELSDAEIEALITIGEDKRAYTLTQNVFLLEERLKCLLIISRTGKHLSDTMREDINNQISTLVEAIQFEHIPDKALELARLMMPVKMEKALEIIDRVAKVTKDQGRIDRLYTAISLTYNREGKNNDADATKADIVNTKIVDEGLRQMAMTMKSIMKDSSANQVVTKMKELPMANSQLYFLNFWIPDHKNRNDIGDAVEYAVKLVIDTSTTTIPQVSFLRHFCVPLPNMKDEQVRKIVGMLDAIVETIKYPTVEYIQLQILVISAVVKFDKEDAKNRLQNLYLEILELKDKVLQAHCKSLLLQNYNRLGDKDDVEKWLSSCYELQKEITKDIFGILDNSAYHMKVVEGPIKALVCEYPTFIKDVITKMNTQERQNRAYLLAAMEYVWQTDVNNLNWKYFKSLFYNVVYDKTELYKVLVTLVNKISDVDNKDQKIFNAVKDNYELYTQIEQADARCYCYANLYVWVCQNHSAEIEFQNTLKTDLENSWQLINHPWLKVITGYEIAKVLSIISMKIEAREYVAKTNEARKNQLISTSSCVAAYLESLNLYVHSLGILIRAKLCTENDIEQFRKYLSYDGDDGECIILWSRLALEYYGVNEMEKFSNIMNRYVSKPLEKYSVFEQKRILFNIAPALYMNCRSLLYNRLKAYDTSFTNACIENVVKYIQTKYPYPEYSNLDEIDVTIPMVYQDLDNIIDLMENSKDDGFIFNYTDIVTDAISKNIQSRLSREQQNVLYNKLEEVVKNRVPMKGGIKHKGYQIACLAMINGRKSGSKNKADELIKEIESIPNKADRAFLYAHVSAFLSTVAEKSDFLERAVRITESLDNTFDKLNRFSLCLQESFTVAKSKSQGIAKQVMISIKSDLNRSYEDYQRIIDIVRDHDEQLAESMMEMVDDDPARVQYKKLLRERMDTTKKLDDVKKDLSKVIRLNNAEQIKFFGRQMEYLIKRKNVIRDVNTTKSILSQVFNNPITDTKNAVLFFMENIYERNQSNKKYNTLLIEMHKAVLYNLQLVLAISAGTKDKFERVNRIMNEKFDMNENMIQVGQLDKGVLNIIEWYRKHPCAIIRIIDPYFHADDLHIIKSFMDINNSLKCSILTSKDCSLKDQTLNEAFQNGWNAVSAEVTGKIEVKTCCYENNPKKAPFHDRWWILFDTENNIKYGKRLASPSTLGSRITELSDMDDNAIDSALKVFERFFINEVPKDNELKLLYEETMIK